MPANLLVLGEADRLRRFDNEQQRVARVRHVPIRRRFRQEHIIARLIGDRPKFGRERACPAMHKIEKVAVEVAEPVRHRRAPPADSDRHVVVRQQHLPAAARVGCVAGNHIGAVDLAPPVLAFDAEDLVRPAGAVDHRHRPGKALAAQMLLAQFTEPDPGLADKTATGEMDPGAHHSTSLLASPASLCHRRRDDAISCRFRGGRVLSVAAAANTVATGLKQAPR